MPNRINFINEIIKGIYSHEVDERKYNLNY